MCVCQGITIAILLTWIEILIGGGWVVPDNMEGGLLHHQVGHQRQRRVSRQLTQIRTWKSNFLGGGLLVDTNRGAKFKFHKDLHHGA